MTRRDWGTAVPPTQLSARELAILVLLSSGARHHRTFQTHALPSVGKLWTRRLLQLRAGDVWQITPTGMAILDARGKIQ